MSRSGIDVSVVIPVRNGERFVAEAIDSAFSQTGVSLEVIVVDNLSADRTREVVAARYGDSVILTHEPRPGGAAARNTGARMATGTYLAFLDADDVWLPRKIELQIHELATRPGTDLVFTHCQEFHDPVLTPEERARFTCRTAPYPFIAASTSMLKREAFLRAGDFPDVRAGEFIAWYGWTQALGLGAFVMPDVLVRRRVHGKNTSLDPASLSAYPLAAKWLLDRRRQAQQIRNG
jgi:glycosyltransferase involved in cell wall biosynthesis